MFLRPPKITSFGRSHFQQGNQFFQNYNQKFNSKLNVAPKRFTSAIPTPSLSASDIVSHDFQLLRERVLKLVETKHPLLLEIASYYFSLSGKGLRPGLVLLMSRAVSTGDKKEEPEKHLNGSNQPSESIPEVLPKQLQLAEIIEMIHTASLIHDDVIDEAATRRGKASVNKLFSAKKAILAGDFLLARASVALARLHSHEVTELLSTSISDLVEGEFMQLKSGASKDWDIYIRKTYLKTASLISNGCRSAAVLGDSSRKVVDLATEFGTNFGIAFQIVDDLLDLTGSADTLGKPILSDARQGLMTAPYLFASEKFPEIFGVIERKCSQEGDIEKVSKMVEESGAVEKTKKLASQYAQKAVDAISQLHQSTSQQALISLANGVLVREK
eukprot:TRINITY_DN6594_c0_g1_i1.p1 TRINITY_DN6594_c0_g1~~TRINITY_DN6594_c0_g1_i1.p1  ORF type:complete len:387 (-),score=98.45 TRINITY_DN6594_c0_g1_i1:83-1243(-)